jgi:hypothetical protein
MCLMICCVIGTGLDGIRGVPGGVKMATSESSKG